MNTIYFIWEKEEKKLTFESKVASLDELKNAIASKINESKERILLKFQDIEDQEIALLDEFDLEYFLDSRSVERKLYIEVTKI